MASPSAPSTTAMPFALNTAGSGSRARRCIALRHRMRIVPTRACATRGAGARVGVTRAMSVQGRPMQALRAVALCSWAPDPAIRSSLRCTRRARLREADVVLVDDLVDRRACALRAQACIIDVGKRGGCKSTPQAYIERLLIREARSGRTVVGRRGRSVGLRTRRRGTGSPGSAREFLVRDRQRITSGIAAAGVAGVPPTPWLRAGRDFRHRPFRGRRGVPDWAALVATHMTLVVYMGVRVADIEAALRHATPAAIVERHTPSAVRWSALPRFPVRVLSRRNSRRAARKYGLVTIAVREA